MKANEKTVNTNQEIVDKCIKNIKFQLRNGVEIKDIDYDEEINDIAYKLYLKDNKSSKKIFIYDDFNDSISLLGEFVLHHVNNEGMYEAKAYNINKEYKVKSARQYHRDYYDGQKRTNKKTGAKYQRANNQLLVENDEEEINTKNQIHWDTYFFEDTFSNGFWELLTDEEYRISKLLVYGYSIKEISEITELTEKQVRGRKNKIKKKIVKELGKIA